MRFSFIATVFNEEKTIDQFLQSILNQSKSPDEIIIVDGGSTDDTVKRLKISVRQAQDKKDLRFKNISFKVIIKKGNRSAGRNEAIQHATGDIILCSDAGNTLDRDWVKNIVKPFEKKTVDVVAGYYKAKPRSVFEKCVVPYALVMPDRIESSNFLPATRSMAFRKEVWKKIGGFKEKLSNNEDYEFARRIKENSFVIDFAKDAVVYWNPRKNLQEFFIMIFRFAVGDGESHILRPKVVLIFIRYILFFLLMVYSPKLLIIAIFLYLLWSIWKNYRYIKHWKAFFYLPALQFCSDIAVILGTVIGYGKSFSMD